jgi:hypothetical protein
MRSHVKTAVSDLNYLADSLRRITSSHIYSQSTFATGCRARTNAAWLQAVLCRGFPFHPAANIGCLVRMCVSRHCSDTAQNLRRPPAMGTLGRIARIRAAQYGVDLSCPCRSITYNARELACDLHYSDSETSGHVDVGNIRYRHCPHFR